MPFFETERLHIHCRQHGSADGLPMLLLHGSHASSRWWTRFFDILPDEILAVAPDLRGCGASDKPDDGYAIEEQARDVWALVQALGWQDFDLVAHSSSAAIAVEFALAHPEALSTLTLIDPTPIEGVHTPVEALTLLDAMQADRELHGAALAALMPTFDAAASAANAEFFEALLDEAQGMAPAAFTGTAAALARWNRLAGGQQLTLPTLLIWGDRDVIVSRDAVTQTLIAIPGANNLEVLQGVGHSPMIEAPLVLAERLFNFLSDDIEAYEEIRQDAYRGDIEHSGEG